MPETDKLFPEYQLLAWLRDETFFSLVSRHHQLWGHVTSAQTCQLMFGSARAGVHHDLPNSLGAFAQRTNALLGDVDSIARERTLLNFYAAFAPPDETANAVACMSGASVAHLKLRLGILTSRFRANHPLKACPQCMEQDLRETGWAYWHLKHQFPGVWMCSYQSRVGDAKRVLTAAAAVDAGKRRQFMAHAGIQGSSIEGSVLDQLFNRPEETSVSTTQLMAIAAREGQRIYSITQDNVASALPSLAVGSAVKQDIENAVLNGMVAFVPEREIAHNGYSGAGYIIMDPDTGAAAYLIDGGRNGLSQPDCAAGVRPPEAEISVATIMNWEALGPALVGYTAGGAATEAEKQAAKMASEAIARAAKTSAQRMAARTGPRILTALAVPGANIALGVALAAALTVEIYLLMIEIKLVMAEFGIQQLTRTDEDTCECKKNSSDPKCACKKIPSPHNPKMPPDSSTIYNRRVIFHHQCADNSRNSYPRNDVKIVNKQGDSISVDLFNNDTQTACEVKTSFRNAPYEPWILNKWKISAVGQIQKQIDIARQCNWNHCIIVNKEWLQKEFESIPGTTVYLRPSCAQPTENDFFERPVPGLD
ncbi:MAG: TniQ family protein [Acidovorax sp.]|uniref:TniQ family protein n=1 Tax=Acidovorax sp. TaxID=1872122 RepID=UPI0026214998|nr:TniQ family protein [Acidovorax sp.]MDH4418182.1 TniQ family protein [Acidovorax sp.]